MDLIFLAKLKQLLSYKYKILFVFIVYLVALSALILANFNYIDDRNRILYGTFDFNWWNRYTSTLLAYIFSLNDDYFVAIFPYSLFISIFLLSMSSIILLKAIDYRLLSSKIALLASASIGLSPYYLENLSYKFDSPFMALSVFVSIFPFLFIRYKKIFVIVSSIGLLIMLTSYQASSGIYAIISIFLAFQRLLKGDKKESLGIVLGFGISYLIAGIIFLIIYNPEATYANNNVLPLRYLLLGIDRHVIDYAKTIYSDMGGGSKVYLALVFAFAIIFITKAVQSARINKILAFALAIFVLCVTFVLSFGLYLIIVTPTFYPRSFVGFGIFVGYLGIYSIHKGKILSSILIIIFVHYLVMFANYYGQALKAQNDYETFRFTILLNDFGKILNTSYMRMDSVFNIQTKGHSGVNPVIAKSRIYYPLITRLIPNLQNSWGWSIAALDNYGITGNGETKECKEYPTTKEYAPMEVLVDTYFHRIESFKPNADMTCFVITYKDITGYKNNFK